MLAGEKSEEEANIAETAGEIVADAGPQQMSLGDYSSSEPLE
jgi:hypothetical protein